MPSWLLPWCLLLLSHHVLSIPPPSPVRCSAIASNCTISNAYGVWGDRLPCPAKSVLYPTTEAELVVAVAHAAKSRLHVKVVTAFSHTIPKLACPPSDGLLISTERLRAEIEVDLVGETVTTDAGVGLRELIDRVEEEGMSLSAAPYWEGVSLGGAISTGSTGSSWWGKGGALHGHVVGLRIVVLATEKEGYAKVVNLEEGDPLLEAARVSLGVLGAISKVCTQVGKVVCWSIHTGNSIVGQAERKLFESVLNWFGINWWFNIWATKLSNRLEKIGEKSIKIETEIKQLMFKFNI